MYLFYCVEQGAGLLCVVCVCALCHEQKTWRWNLQSVRQYLCPLAICMCVRPYRPWCAGNRGRPWLRRAGAHECCSGAICSRGALHAPTDKQCVDAGCCSPTPSCMVSACMACLTAYSSTGHRVAVKSEAPWLISTTKFNLAVLQTGSASGRSIRGAQVKEVGQALGAPVLDLWTALQREPGWEALLEDGLHFTAAGQRAVRDALLAFISERLPHLRCVPSTPAKQACFLPGSAPQIFRPKRRAMRQVLHIGECVLGVVMSGAEIYVYVAVTVPCAGSQHMGAFAGA